MSVEIFDAETELQSVVTVSDIAAEHFYKQISRTDNTGVRISLKKSGCTGYKYVVEAVLDAPATDVRIELENGLLVFIDSQYLSAIQGTHVDIRKQGLNVNLVLENPNVKDECGCGESFSIEGAD